jgi:hypothetical protein
LNDDSTEGFSCRVAGPIPPQHSPYTFRCELFYDPLKRI